MKFKYKHLKTIFIYNLFIYNLFIYNLRPTYHNRNLKLIYFISYIKKICVNQRNLWTIS